MLSLTHVGTSSAFRRLGKISHSLDVLSQSLAVLPSSAASVAAPRRGRSTLIKRVRREGECEQEQPQRTHGHGYQQQQDGEVLGREVKAEGVHVAGEAAPTSSPPSTPASAAARAAAFVAIADDASVGSYSSSASHLSLFLSLKWALTLAPDALVAVAAVAVAVNVNVNKKKLLLLLLFCAFARAARLLPPPEAPLSLFEKEAEQTKSANPVRVRNGLPAQLFSGHSRSLEPGNMGLGLTASKFGIRVRCLFVVALAAPTVAFQPSQLRQSCGTTSRRAQIARTKRHQPFYAVTPTLADAESKASTAAETWTVEATPFMEPDLAEQIEEHFEDRADVVAFRVVGGRRMPVVSMEDVSPGEGRRSRFVFMHPDLGLDVGTAESEYCTVIRVENVNMAASNTFPNALASIGVHLENVGDIVVEDSSTAYLVVDPGVSRQCLRLLSKELVGVGITLSVCGETEFMPHGEIQDMKLSRLLERQMERKKYEKGYVQFS
ncbi:hypothetical protein ACHAWF_009521 [Thalassiosira exigua]